jgi:acyl-homoserine lactone acylase PvdQ
MRKLTFLLLIATQVSAQHFSNKEIAGWEQQAKQVTIIRDNWGIPHVYGKTDADAVFGLLYAQCEDDFKRVESNYIGVLGRTAEVSGINSLYDDLLTKLVIDSASAVTDYQKSPAWLKKLLQAYADGINYYLYKHPTVKPALLQHFEPWYPLMWTDGSIAAINTGGVNVSELKSFYTGDQTVAITAPIAQEDIHTGSNGFAVAPSRTASGKAMLYINPHVTFYFRPEVHMVSEQGLNAYGAVTWGQLFVYQGFNEHCGWMHTSGYSDVADLYAEQIVQQGDSLYYRYDGKLLPVKKHTITLSYKEGSTIISKQVVTYATHHGPVMAKRNGQWISVRAVNRNMNGLIQSWQRTKSTSFAAFKKNMELLANSSNNTVYADAEGNIAYWHGNFIPRRDTSFDWNKPVDGTIKTTEWMGLHTVDQSIHLYNPASGWIQNCNSTPFTASGMSSPKKADYPAYMSTEPENFRGLNAVRVLGRENAFTVDKLIAAGYDTYLTAFEELVPAVVKAYSTLSATDSLYAVLAEPIKTLGSWDLRSSANSVATSLAIEWAQTMQNLINRVEAPDFVARVSVFAKTAPSYSLLQQLASAVSNLNRRYTTWQTPWGTINRYQRLTGQLHETYDDSKPSIPSGMVASTWGCLPSFVSRVMPGTKKRYGYNGNSFICAIEFGKKVTAKSLLAGGNSSDPGSAHFGDQAEMYTKGKFKEVLFYKEDVLKHVERSYHPGE